eukprot:597555-Pleurochrysis_carterae.AAC.1
MQGAQALLLNAIGIGSVVFLALDGNCLNAHECAQLESGARGSVVHVRTRREEFYGADYEEESASASEGEGEGEEEGEREGMGVREGEGEGE